MKEVFYDIVVCGGKVDEIVDWCLKGI